MTRPRDRAIVGLLASLLPDLRRNRLVGTIADLRPLLVEHSAAVDEHNEYERVTAEHQAFAHLLAQLPER